MPELAALARRLARLASASRPSGLRLLSGKEWSFGDVGGLNTGGLASEVGEGGWSVCERRACVALLQGFGGDGDRETMPDAMLGLPIDLSTVSKVRSIFLRDLVRSSCFLVLELSVRMTESLKIKGHTWMCAFHD